MAGAPTNLIALLPRPRTGLITLSSKNLSHKIDPAINIVGLGKLVEGVVSNEKTLVIGKL